MLNRESHYDEVFDAQLHFRMILDAMAKPGVIKIIDGIKINPPMGIHHSSILIGFALFNADASFCSLQLNQKEITDYLVLNTGGLSILKNAADFIFINGLQSSELLSSIKIGTLEYPENGATVIIDVENISDCFREGYKGLKLSGPGIADEHHVFVNGLNDTIISFRSEINSEYPLGVDLILTDEHHKMVCIPRTSKIILE